MPGHTQLTRMPSRAYSTAATFASWITAAFVAQYGAACDHAVRPETEAVRTIDPGPLRAHDGHRGADAVDGAEHVDPERALPVFGRQVVDATVRREHPGVADQHVEPAEALHREGDDGFDVRDLADVGRQGLDRAHDARAGRFTVASSDGALTSLEHDIGVGLARELTATTPRRASRPRR